MFWATWANSSRNKSEMERPRPDFSDVASEIIRVPLSNPILCLFQPSSVTPGLIQCGRFSYAIRIRWTISIALLFLLEAIRMSFASWKQAYQRMYAADVMLLCVTVKLSVMYK